MTTVASGDTPTILRCPFAECNTRIIPLTPELKQALVTISGAPDMITSSADAHETANEFYVVNDVWDFDNIGVSRPTDEAPTPDIADFTIQRLLVCSECDRGPLGFAGYAGTDDDVKKLRYYLSSTSVKET